MRSRRRPRPPSRHAGAQAILATRRLDLTLRRPLVELSLIGEDHSDDETSLEDGWVRPFLHAGATAVVGPRWTVAPAAARRFTRALHTALRTGSTLAAAASAARACVRDAFPARPDWLAFTVYGHPLCRPYRVRPSNGFALVEALDTESEGRIAAGATYSFRATWRAEAPAWYSGRLHALEEPVDGELAVVAVPMDGGPALTQPLVHAPGSDAYHGVVALTMPDTEGLHAVRVYFVRGDEELRSVTLTLDVEPATG